MDRLVDTLIGIDPELLHKADQALAKSGVALADAVTAFLEQVVQNGGMPAAMPVRPTWTRRRLDESAAQPPAVLDQAAAKAEPPVQPEPPKEAPPKAASSAALQDDDEFEEAVREVAKGSVYTSAEIKAYLQQMEGL
ncbi:MAG: type II toxin-antitoxin system RelB/DinJ family antitoxin [Clostridia bacterium]|nr:type II toxin-antitoxin system RelB/DinJ family antitoxin [Clostridia bacterium]